MTPLTATHFRDTMSGMKGEELLLLLRARHEPARAHLVTCAEANGGDLKRTADGLEIGRASLYRALERDPALAARVAAVSRGRGGSEKGRAYTRPKKSTKATSKK